MSLIKELSKVKDEEITLQDVKRAEEIIARANKLLGRPEKCNHYHGTWFSQPYFSSYGVGTNTVNLKAGTLTGKQNTLTANSSIVNAALSLKESTA